MIPTVAIDGTVVFPKNPVFGLNALGGAISIEMKNGFTWQGTEFDLRGGSRGRAMGTAQTRQQIGNFATYIALEGIDDRGYRQFSPSYVRRLYGDLGYRAEDVELHLNIGSASNFFSCCSRTIPQCIRRRRRRGMPSGRLLSTVPTTSRSAGQCYFRGLKQNHIDGNTTDVLRATKAAACCAKTPGTN